MPILVTNDRNNIVEPIFPADTPTNLFNIKIRYYKQLVISMIPLLRIYFYV